MSFAALFWAFAAFIQACMLSQYGQKQLQYAWLNTARRKLLSFSALIFLACSFGLNYWYEGSSVGPLSWLFVILPAAFFLQVLGFYLFRKYFVKIWWGAMLAALIFTLAGS
ncbi:hypothetical protein [Acinetobacter dispersus]|uniref:hypothetical protein n=1 Tax=Acinetobacter dispersus TaxID=70348 RepID=UPI00300AAAF9